MLTTARRIALVQMLSIVSISLAAAAPAGAVFDHLQCFKIKDNAAAATYVADIDPSDLAFAALPPSCQIKVPAKLLCVDAEKTNVTPAPPGAADGLTAQPYLCYKAKCTKVQPTASLTDQFGLHGVEVKSTKMVCAPIPQCTDGDSDTYTDCAGDCNDGNSTINPGAVEVCNAVDDDCDGNQDEMNPGGGNPCSTGQPGICASGITFCNMGSISCSQSVSPESETCDGVDEDCDGFVDNDTTGLSCSTGFPGVCSAGSTTCVGGVPGCQQNTMASPETCNSLDDDCDGSADEGNPGGGGACSTGYPGICSLGTLTCSAGSLTCVANTTPGTNTETCNGQDDDCDGSTDEFNPGGGSPCSTGMLGVCSAGTTNCISGAVQCTQNTASSPEVCDSFDNDCDGSVDEGGVCLLANGSPCTMSSNCSSNQCVDGVCCDVACAGVCQACSAAKKGSGSDGTCGNIANLTDPDSECAGTCNGAGACQP